MRHSIGKINVAILIGVFMLSLGTVSALAAENTTTSTPTGTSGSPAPDNSTSTSKAGIMLPSDTSTPASKASILAPTTKKPEQKLIVQAIGVEGLKSVSSQVVLGAIKKTAVGEEFNQDAVRTDLQSIVDTGYFQNVEAKYSQDGNNIKVTFLPVENEIISKFVVESEVLEPAVLRKYFAQKEGEVLNYKQLQDDLKSLQERVIKDHGFVVWPADVQAENGQVLIKIAPIKIEDIIIKGNQKTKTPTIMREFGIKPGDNLNMNRLGRDLQRIWHLGFFDDVSYEFTQAKAADATNVVVQVVERKTGVATFGAGYSTVDGVIGYVEYSDDNFIGRGERVSVRTEFGQKKTSYDLGFYEPYLFGSRTSFGANLYNRTSDRTSLENDIETPYKEYSQGGDLSFGRPLGDYTSGSITLKLDNTRIVQDNVPDETTHTRSLIFQTNTDTTDHPFYPLSGMRAKASLELAGKFAGGDAQFAKYVGETSRYIKVGSADQVLAFRLVGGGSVGDLNLHQQFSIGGADSVRGYKYGSMQGDKMLYMNSEYRFKIAKSLQAALFVDAGQAWKSGQTMPALKVGYGAGLRLDTPLGIMRLDYGIGEKGGNTFFSIGPSF